jgi:ubiquinone/menaquinone biosynthesis C-methylase UbiE
VRRPAFIAAQSSRPTGLFGRFLARIMALETRAANRAAVRALGVADDHRVLEIGFGHGRTIALLANAAPGARVDGIDASADMVRAAARRCRALVAAGRARLVQGDSERLPFDDGSFDKVLSVHTLYFWDEPAQHFKEIRRVLKLAGVLALGFKERSETALRSFPSPPFRFYSSDEIDALLLGAGFASVASERVAGVVLTRATR